MAILGAILVDSSCLPVVMSLLSTDSFYKEAHRIIYDACRALYDRNDTIDIITVVEELKSAQNLDMVGGAYYVSTLINRIGSAANVEAHCRIIQQLHMKRIIIKKAAESHTMAYEHHSDPFECLDILEQSVTTINEVIASGGNMKSITMILDEAETEARKRETLYQSGKCTGIPTGLTMLDQRTSGWQGGDLVILAGRPSMGKTALMLHHAMSAGVHACIYSLEMSAVSIMNRMILSMCDIEAAKFRAGAMNETDWKEFYKAKRELSLMPIHIDDNSVVSTRYIKAHSKLMKDKGQCDIIFVDYLQLADMRSDRGSRNREQEVSQAAREFKIIAKTLNVPVILLSQLSRACESRPDKKPLLSDLRESGAIEQDADIVIFAYRPAYYNLTPPDGEDWYNKGFEIIAKGRNIGVGEIPFAHNDSMTKIWGYNEPKPLPVLRDRVEPSTYSNNNEYSPF